MCMCTAAHSQLYMYQYIYNLVCIKFMTSRIAWFPTHKTMHFGSMCREQWAHQAVRSK